MNRIGDKLFGAGFGIILIIAGIIGLACMAGIGWIIILFIRYLTSLI